jgi:hypothetical protein
MTKYTMALCKKTTNAARPYAEPRARGILIFCEKEIPTAGVMGIEPSPSILRICLTVSSSSARRIKVERLIAAPHFGHAGTYHQICEVSQGRRQFQLDSDLRRRSWSAGTDQTAADRA